MLKVLTFFIIIIIATIAYADPSTKDLNFSWNAVAINTDGSPCLDLAGYAIYRSREADNWNALTGPLPAYANTCAEQTKVSVICPESGIWYWVVRAFNTPGNYSGISNIIETDVSLDIPGAILDFKLCIPSDLDCDGDIDGTDLSILAESFGK